MLLVVIAESKKISNLFRIQVKVKYNVGWEVYLEETSIHWKWSAYYTYCIGLDIGQPKSDLN